MAEVWTPPALNDITTAELVTVAYLNGLGNSLRFLKEVNYTPFTSDKSITTTADIDIVSSGAITYEAVPHLIELYALRATAAAAGSLQIQLKDGATELGIYASIPLSTSVVGRIAAARITPTAASHTYKWTGFNTASQTSTIFAGAGGADTNAPGFIRITRIPT